MPWSVVTTEYLESATPGIGVVRYDDGYKPGKHENEIAVAEWIRDIFGGDIRILNEKGFMTVSPDYIWREKLWELKNPSTMTSTDNAVKKALRQIENRPGGIILDYGENEITDGHLKVIKRRIERSAVETVDVILLRGPKIVDIFRYKK